MIAVGMGDARAKLTSLIRRACEDDEMFIVHSKGEPKVVIMCVDRYLDMEATIEEASDPGSLHLMQEAENEVKRARARSAGEVLGEGLIRGKAQSASR